MKKLYNLSKYCYKNRYKQITNIECDERCSSYGESNWKTFWLFVNSYNEIGTMIASYNNLSQGLTIGAKHPMKLEVTLKKSENIYIYIYIHTYTHTYTHTHTNEQTHTHDKVHTQTQREKFAQNLN